MVRMSLRELLVLVAAVALAIVSLTYASEVWLAIVLAATMLAFFVALIVAAVDRGPRQAFAIGFALTMLGYWLIVLNGQTRDSGGSPRNLEFDHWEGRLPTTRLLRYAHMGLNRNRWVDSTTGKEVPNYDQRAQPIAGNVVGGSFVPTIQFVESPPREILMPIGHCWWGLLLGYSGGLFAAFVYLRRMKEQKPLAA